MTPSPALPYWSLSAWYLAYFATVGALVPYLGLHLAAAGYSALQIGGYTALLVVGRVVAPNFWGYIVDRGGSRMRVVRLTAVGALLAFLLVWYAHAPWLLAAALLVYGFFWSGSLPLIEANTLSHLGAAVADYSRIRLWGSLGFILAVAGVGSLIDAVGIAVLGPVVITLLVTLWVAGVVVPDAARPRQVGAQGTLTDRLRSPTIAALLLSCFLMQAGHGPYYAFLSIYLESFGYSKTIIGQLWSLGVIAEVVLFSLMPRLLRHADLRTLLLAGSASAVLRWALIATWPQSPACVVVVQLLHAGTFALHHAAAIQIVHRHFTGPHQGRGQALYSSVSFGLGGACGSLAGGAVWSAFGPSATFSAAAVCSALALFVTWRWIGREARALDGRVGAA